MTTNADENDRLRAAALRNAQTILVARERAEEALRKQSEWWRTTLSSIGDAVISTDADGRVTFMNRVAETVTGWTEVEALERPLLDIFHIINEQSREFVENPVLRAMQEGVVVGIANHTILIARDGTERPIEDSAAPIRDEQGQIVGCVLVFRDVTERKRDQDARAHLAAIIEASDDAIVSKTLDGIILSWNVGAERHFGYTAAEAIGRSIDLIIPHELRAEERSILERLRRGERIAHFETVRVSKSGQRLDISLTVSPVRDSAGRIVGASKVARDITEHKRAEQALRESEQRFRLMADAAPVLIWMCGRDKLRTWFNKNWLEFVGRSMEQETGNGWEDNIHPADCGRCLGIYSAAFDAHQPFSMEFRLRRHDGQYRWLLDHGSPLRELRGDFGGYIGSCVDITERQQAEEKLRAADRRKDEFLATLAHELRNPLAPIRNSVEIMKLAEGNRDVLVQARDSIERQLSHMVRLVDDLIDVSRITRDQVELRKSRVELAAIIHQAVETCRPLAECEDQTFQISLPVQPIYLDADPVRLAQVFSNLLNNGCKYTHRGGTIWLGAERQDGHVVVWVKDYGIGIPRDKLESIFEMFMQVDKSLERSRRGLGIGLTLVRRLVELHGGSITAASGGPGQGSEFTVRLPILVEESKPQPAPSAGAKSPTTARRVLVVDDNHDAAETLAMLLKMNGHHTRLAHDGLEALAAAAAFRPDIVLLDIGLPKLDGLETARKIRKQPWGSAIVLVALTGWGQEEDRRKSHDAGFNAHLVKPVDHDALLEILARD